MLLNNINPHKATGPDEIPTRLMKKTAEGLVPVLITFFGASLNQWKFSNDQKTEMLHSHSRKAAKQKQKIIGLFR